MSWVLIPLGIGRKGQQHLRLVISILNLCVFCQAFEVVPRLYIVSNQSTSICIFHDLLISVKNPYIRLSTILLHLLQIILTKDGRNFIDNVIDIIEDMVTNGSTSTFSHTTTKFCDGEQIKKQRV